MALTGEAIPTASRPKRGISASILNKASHILNNMPNNKALEEPGAKDGNVSSCWSCICLSCPPSIQHAWLEKTQPVERRLAWVLSARFLLNTGNEITTCQGTCRLPARAECSRALLLIQTGQPQLSGRLPVLQAACLTPDIVSAGKLVRWAGLQWGAGAAECQSPTHLQRGRAAADGNRYGPKAHRPSSMQPQGQAAALVFGLSLLPHIKQPDSYMSRSEKRAPDKCDTLGCFQTAADAQLNAMQVCVSFQSVCEWSFEGLRYHQVWPSQVPCHMRSFQEAPSRSACKSED